MYEKTLSRKTLHQGRILAFEELTVELENGRTAHREIVHHGGATAILVRRADGLFVLVRQFRKAVEQILLEAVAGGLEPGEAPEDCARREVREETGYLVTRIQSLGRIFLSPGYCDEALHLFYAETGNLPSDPDPDEDEKVEAVLLSADELAAAMAPGGEIEDAKTLALWSRFRAVSGVGSQTGGGHVP